MVSINLNNWIDYAVHVCPFGYGQTHFSAVGLNIWNHYNMRNLVLFCRD